MRMMIMMKEGVKNSRGKERKWMGSENERERERGNKEGKQKKKMKSEERWREEGRIEE